MLEAQARELSLITIQIRKEFSNSHTNLYSEFMRSHRLWLRYKFVRDSSIEEINQCDSLQESYTDCDQLVSTTINA